MSERLSHARHGHDGEPPSRRAGMDSKGVGLVNEPCVVGDAILKGMGSDPASQLSRLTRFAGTNTAAAITRLQQTYGNAYVQRIAAAEEGTLPGDDSLARRIEAASGSGAALDTDMRRQIENGLDADLSGVRLHTDAEADHLARTVNAVAFTTGSDIFFRSGAYDPSSAEGIRLLAHEAAHAVQQAQGPVAGEPAHGGVSISDPADSFEQAAENASMRMMAGGSVTEVGANTGATSPGAIGGFNAKPIQRFPDFWDWTQGPYGWYKNWSGASGQPTPATPSGYEGQPRPYPVAQPEPVTPKLPQPGAPTPTPTIPEAAPTPRVPYAPPGVPTPNVPTPNVPVVEPAPPSMPPPSVEPPTVPRPLAPPGEIPPTLRSPGVQPPPSGPPSVPPASEPIPPTLRSPGATGPGSSGLASAGRGLGTLAMGGLGTILGGLQLYQGVQGAMEAKSATDTILPGLQMGAGGAMALGGIGTMTGSASLASLGPAGAVLGSGLAGFGLGRALDEGVGWGMEKIMGPGKGDYSISGMMGKDLYKADEAISSLIDSDPNKPAYKKTLAWKLANWLD